MEWAEVWDRIYSILYPQRCLFCNAVVAYQDFWCGKCGNAGEPPFTRLGCIECYYPNSFDGALAAIDYSGDVRKLIWRLKDEADTRILQFFGAEMRDMVKRYWDDIHFDLIVPVPSAASRLKERGFNQAERLARYLSGCTGIPMLSDALVRHEDTQVQHGLTAAERRVNAEKSYDYGNAEGVADKTVLLVDDVFTTGYTAAACSGKLLEAGAGSVYIVTASRASRQSQKDNEVPVP